MADSMNAVPTIHCLIKPDNIHFSSLSQREAKRVFPKKSEMRKCENTLLLIFILIKYKNPYYYYISIVKKLKILCKVFRNVPKCSKVFLTQKPTF